MGHVIGWKPRLWFSGDTQGPLARNMLFIDKRKPIKLSDVVFDIPMGQGADRDDFSLFSLALQKRLGRPSISPSRRKIDPPWRRGKTCSLIKSKPAPGLRKPSAAAFLVQTNLTDAVENSRPCRGFAEKKSFKPVVKTKTLCANALQENWRLFFFGFSFSKQFSLLFRGKPKEKGRVFLMSLALMQAVLQGRMARG
jgi:hypothetical protein